jgi:phosphatidylinositol 4-kinase A
MDAHQYMAQNMEELSPYREILLCEILNSFVEFWAGEVDSPKSPSPLLPKFFQTVSEVLPEPRFSGQPQYDEETIGAFRNMWFACIIHGILPNSKWVRTYSRVLRKVAANSPLLAPESVTNDFDADLELNPVLNRIKERNVLDRLKEGKFHSLKALEEDLMRQLPSHASEIRRFDTPKLVFTAAVMLVESLRSENGNCSLALDYFDHPNLQKSDACGVLMTIVENVHQIFLDTLRGNSFEMTGVALGQRELRELLIRCCDPVPTVQTLAAKCCNRLITSFPALLCFEKTTYVLLELLTLLWDGCLSQETDLVLLH